MISLFSSSPKPQIPYPNLDSPFALHPQGIDSIGEDSYVGLKRSVEESLLDKTWKGPLNAINYATKAALYYGAVGILLLADTLLKVCILNKDSDEPYESELVRAMAFFKLSQELLTKDSAGSQSILSKFRIASDELTLQHLESKLAECYELIPPTSLRENIDTEVEDLLAAYLPPLAQPTV